MSITANRLVIINDDAITALRTLPDESVQCCVTSPPYYGLRSYLETDNPAKQSEIGTEETPQQYVGKMVELFREVNRVLRDDGVLWLNLGDSYAAGGRGTNEHHREKMGVKQAVAQALGAKKAPAGFKPKDLLLIPSRVAMALQADGWYLRAACPWIKRNAMPESCKDRPTTTIETIFLFSKSADYYYDAEAVKVVSAQPTRKRADRFGDNKNTGETTTHSDCSTFTRAATRARRSSDWFIESWQGLLQDDADGPLAFVVNTKPYKGAHFACFPPELIRPCILAGAKLDDTILDPFGGSGTTAQVALELGRKAILVELNPDYIPLIRQRCNIAA